MRLILGLALFASGAAMAADVPLELAHQGRLMDALGTPLSGPHDLDIALYDTPSGGTAVWSETLAGVVFTEGYYDVAFGQTSGNELEVADFAGGELYVGLTIDAGAELPARLPL